MIKRQDIVVLARGWIGTPYHHQASVKGVGADCLGLIRGIYRELCGEETETVPAYTRDWAEARGRETLLMAAHKHLIALGSFQEAAPGDVLIFRLNDRSVAKHAAIMSVDNKMVHAQEKRGCVEVNLGRWWQRRVAGVFQFPGAV